MKICMFLLLVFLTDCSGGQQASQHQVNQAKFEGLYRAGKTIDAAVVVSVTLPRFRELVQAFATEVSIAKDKSTAPAERNLMELYADVLDVYRDSLALWDAQIAQKSESIDPGVAQLCYGDVGNIAAKYLLPCVEYGPSGMKVLPSKSQQYLWTVAGVKLRKANAAYLNDANLEVAEDLGAIKTALYAPLTQIIENEKATRDKRAKEEGIARDRRANEERVTREKDRVTAEQWKKLVVLSEKAKDDPSALFVNEGITIYHFSKSCGILPPGFIPVLRINIPSTYEPCRVCKP